jgi:hypothetical protein
MLYAAFNSDSELTPSLEDCGGNWNKSFPNKPIYEPVDIAALYSRPGRAGISTPRSAIKNTK